MEAMIKFEVKNKKEFKELEESSKLEGEIWSLIDDENNLKFEEYKLSTDKPDKKTKRYEIISAHSGEILGKIFWWGAWRQYVHELNEGIIMSVGCDKELTAFKEKLNKEHKKK